MGAGQWISGANCYAKIDVPASEIRCLVPGELDSITGFEDCISHSDQYVERRKKCDLTRWK